VPQPFICSSAGLRLVSLGDRVNEPKGVGYLRGHLDYKTVQTTHDFKIND